MFLQPATVYRGAKEHNATKKGRDCLQKDYLAPDHIISGGEDCLYLNIYRKEVIIYITSRPIRIRTISDPIKLKKLRN